MLARHHFGESGKVSLWATTKPVAGLHRDFLEGCDQLFMWLLVDYEVAIDGAFATNFSSDGGLVPIRDLIYDLHASGSFTKQAEAAASDRKADAASFVVALYDCAYDPAAIGLSTDERGSDWLAFVGAFSYEE